MPNIAEIVTFTLIAGTDPAAFLDAAKATDPIVQAQPGFVERRLSQGPDGRWTDYVLWTDMDAAQTAARVVMETPAFAAFAGLIAPDDMTMRHETVRAVFE